MANGNLTKAKNDKNDEFYTQLPDIENELRHYKAHFKGKTVYCNCDDPLVSNFFRYFSLNFEHLGLNKLIATCYQSDTAGARTDLSSDTAVMIEYCGGAAVEGYPTVDDMTVVPLKGDGDFRSDECIEILKSADIIVTNPPFSLFREYIAQLMEYEKSFIIIGSMNAITYKEFFPLLKHNQVWLGNKSGGLEFEVPMDFEQNNTYVKNDKKFAKFGNIVWFTNLDFARRHENIILYKDYAADEYPTYDNYDAIEVAKVKDIPRDYEGVMGVPITFLQSHNPKQFEILGMTTGREEFGIGPSKRYVGALQVNKNGTTANGSKANTRATILLDEAPTDSVYYRADNADSPMKIVYARILVRRIMPA